MSTRIVFDIETSSLPWEQISPFYVPPPALPPFDPSMVKYGNTKDVTKRAEKFAEVKAAYERQLADEAATREAHRLEFADKAALSALTGQVVAIGFKSKKGSQIVSCVVDGVYDEDETIKKFWGVYELAVKAKRKMVGHNVENFDLPFLTRRSWVLGVPVPAGVLEQGRFWSRDVFVDTMKIWGCGRGDMISLNDLSTAMGGPGKPKGESKGCENCKCTGQVLTADGNGMVTCPACHGTGKVVEEACEGARFAAMWRSGDPVQVEKARQYLVGDCEMTWFAAEKMGIE